MIINTQSPLLMSQPSGFDISSIVLSTSAFAVLGVASFEAGDEVKRNKYHSSPSDAYFFYGGGLFLFAVASKMLSVTINAMNAK